MAKKTEQGRTTLGASPKHGDALRVATVAISRDTPGGMTTRGVLDAIIEGNEGVWKAVVAEFNRQKRSKRRK